jgi:hypothetical protein
MSVKLIRLSGGFDCFYRFSRNCFLLDRLLSFFYETCHTNAFSLKYYKSSLNYEKSHSVHSIAGYHWPFISLYREHFSSRLLLRMEKRLCSAILARVIVIQKTHL